ncbi:MAG: rhodanese-like domain-containing protein [Acidobacteriota bacterium]
MRRLRSLILGLTLLALLALTVVGCPATRESDQATAAAASPESEGSASREQAGEAVATETPEGTVSLVSRADLLEQISADTAPMILDVRTPEEFDEGHVPGAINITHTELADRLAELEAARDSGLVVYCRSERRATIAEKILRQAGFSNVMHRDGDMLAWLEAGLPTEK